MPKRCLEAGCQALVDGTRCAAHGGKIHNSRTWKRISRAARAASPLCALCGATDDLTADHVRRGSLARGVRVLCRPCNSRRG